MTKAERMTALTAAVRAVFNRLKALGDDLHGDLEVTAAMRAVMETLAAEGAMTVPQIARLKGVTRQHIQLLADALAEAGLAVVKENPAHRRSSLIALTDKGKRTFTKMRAREVPVVANIATEFDAQDLDRATALLTRLAARLEERLKQEA
jgi:DNA-binding MarR family transcriptional regulator